MNSPRLFCVPMYRPSRAPNPRPQRMASAPLSRQPTGRTRRHIRAFALLPVLFLAASRVLADSDGYFCTSEGYLAYELREWNVPDKKHVLRIIRVGGHQGIEDSSPLVLGDFQLHEMKCSPHEIVISSWDSTYVVALPANAPPVIKSVLPHQPGDVSQGRALSESITDSRRSSVVGIPVKGTGNTYELQIVHVEENHTTAGKGGLIRHRTTSKVVEKDRAGKTLHEKLIHAGTFDETVD
jgi:hypothetical protein